MMHPSQPGDSLEAGGNTVQVMGQPPCMSSTDSYKKQRLSSNNCIKSSRDIVRISTSLLENLCSFALKRVTCGSLCKQAGAAPVSFTSCQFTWASQFLKPNFMQANGCSYSDCRRSWLQSGASFVALLESVCCCDTELFNWVLEPKKITVDQAMRCAKREPGRSWEAIESELNKLGKHSWRYFGCTYTRG